MPTIVISGYYGAGNAGDEAVLAAMLQALRGLLPTAEFIVLSADPAQTASAHGVSAVGRASPRRLIRLFRRADLLLSGGGGLLQDVYPRRRLPVSVLYYLGICALAKLCGCRVMFYAQGVGPLEKRLSRVCVRLIGNTADLIAVRDRESADLLRRIGVDRPPLQVTADPVLGWEPDPAADPAGLLAAWGAQALEPAHGRPWMAVSVRPWPGEEDHLRAVAEAVDRAVEAWEIRPVFVPFARGADREEARRVLAMMTRRREAVILPDIGPAQAMAVIARADLLLGMRLHSLIFAAKAGVPMIGLAYDPKVRSFLAGIGMHGYVLDLTAGADEIWGALSAGYARRGAIREALAARLPAWRSLARSNAELAADVLRGSFDRAGHRPLRQRP